MSVSSNGRILSDLKKELRGAQKKIAAVLTSLSGSKKEQRRTIASSKDERGTKKLGALFKQLEKKVFDAQSKIQKGSDKQASAFRKKIQKIERLKASLLADNHLLEIKRKDLLLKATEIEIAYDKISKRNQQLVEQKNEIDHQTEKLRIANQEVVEKNQELENRAESLLDQADYLHEANETISSMHQELATQKDEILRKNEELQNLNEEKNNLIGIVAHDLKSPLNQIKGLVQLIKMTSKLDGEASNCLNMIESSAVRLNSMIGKILDIEAIESRQMNLTIEPVNLSEVISGLAGRFMLDAEHKQITLHISVPAGIAIPVDRNYLNQILENLLSNAIKFSPPMKNIYVVLHNTDDYVVAEVRDEGPGLTDEDKKKLFSKYQKLSAKPTGSESSTGLGLSIVKKFTESMGGQIWCESEAGRGASFFVKFFKSQK